MMKKWITAQDRLKIYAAYMPCGVYINGLQWKIIGVNWGENEITRGDYPDENCESLPDTYYSETFEECQLILTPISELSHDDATELAKILGWDYNNEPDSDAHYDLEGLRDDIANNGDDVFDVGFTKSQIVIDYLRSKGYDCGYGEIPSLIAAGIAIPRLNGANATEVDG